MHQEYNTIYIDCYKKRKKKLLSYLIILYTKKYRIYID